ncbi:hypothetical protein [Amycolatopsis plumensis]|uniref:DUF4252 domain-containing protein n=1 Tax=Amycolatopsis plumensis TaxID=236508 RepID=A0ABV5UC40_9PSEU
MTSEQHQEVLEVEPGELTEIRRLAEENGVELQDVEVDGLELVTAALVVLVGVPAAVHKVLREIDYWRGGQVIDRREGAERVVYRTRSLRHDLLVVLANDGDVKIQYLRSDGTPTRTMESLTKVILSLRSADSETIVGVAESVMGSAASVTMSPAGAELPAATE